MAGNTTEDVNMAKVVLPPYPPLPVFRFRLSRMCIFGSSRIPCGGWRATGLHGLMTELILNRDHYTRLISEVIPAAKQFLWLATADLKDLHVSQGRRFVPFLAALANLVSDGVAVRLIHAKEPGPRFREDFDRFPELLHSELFERVLCPRVHTKAVIVDGCLAYLGSANLTGAGIGAKNNHRRNFEAGILTDEPSIVEPLMEELDTLWRGEHCQKCQRRDVCPDPIT